MGCGEMKRRGNRAAKGGMEMEIYMGNQKRGRKIKRKLLSIGAGVRRGRRRGKKDAEQAAASRKEGWVLLILERNWRLGKHGLRNRKRSASP